MERARFLEACSRAPREQLGRHRRELHQKAREMRAASRRRVAERVTFQRRIAALVLGRKLEAAVSGAAAGRRTLRTRAAALERAAASLGRRESESLRRQAAALRAHDPQRTLERGYALALDQSGEPLTSVAAVRDVERFELRVADGSVPAEARDGG